MKALGISPWGYVHSRASLVNKDKYEMNNANYVSNIPTEHGKCPTLDPNHTHFLLVDDGYRNR